MLGKTGIVLHQLSPLQARYTEKAAANGAQKKRTLRLGRRRNRTFYRVIVTRRRKDIYKTNRAAIFIDWRNIEILPVGGFELDDKSL